jgi:hypothetical protein
MTRLLPILLLSCCLAPVALALEGAAGAEEMEQTENNELTIELNKFVRDAINEGLLTAADKTGQLEKQEVAVEVPAELRTVDRTSIPIEIDCAAPFALDFAELTEFDRYQQIYSIRDEVSVQSGTPEENGGVLRLAKAYLALGLFSEANATINSLAVPEASAYRKFATMMEHRVSADADYFRQLADCHEEANIWLAVALLINDQDEGARLLADQLNSFRTLPFQLKAEVVALAIPALDKRNDRILAVKMMADFTDDQIRDTPQLRFARAIIGLGQNDSGSESELRSFLNEPAYQEQALSALLRRGRKLNGLQEDLLLSELMKKFGQADNDTGLASSLQFALQELGASSHYGPIMELAMMPKLQNEEAQREIRRQFLAGIQRDLASDNSLRNLAAINALASEQGILDAAPEREDVYRSGATVAVRFGLASIARGLADKGGADTDVIEQLASLEFLGQDYQAVYTWARTYPESAAVNLLAARAAIREGNDFALTEFDSHLELSPEAVVTLIEEDAASGHWMVADEVYRAANALDDSVLKQRAERVFAMRRNAWDLAAGPKKVAMTSIPAVLKRTDARPEQVTGGAH